MNTYFKSFEGKMTNVQIIDSNHQSSEVYLTKFDYDIVQNRDIVLHTMSVSGDVLIPIDKVRFCECDSDTIHINTTEVDIIIQRCLYDESMYSFSPKTLARSFNNKYVQCKWQSTLFSQFSFFDNIDVGTMQIVCDETSLNIVLTTDDGENIMYEFKVENIESIVCEDGWTYIKVNGLDNSPFHRAYTGYLAIKLCNQLDFIANAC